MPHLIRLEDDSALDPGEVGFKFASLARARRAGFAVPEAAALPTAVHRRFRETGSLPDELAGDLETAAAALAASDGLAVRSSATLEDLPGRSFAGIYRSFLGVRGAAQVRARVAECWESADAAAARAYLGETAPAGEPPAMAVVLQRLVPARAAGVAFSRNPLFPDRDEVVIEAVAGLGEALVSGHVSPYRATVGGGEGEGEGLFVEAPPKGAAGSAPLSAAEWRAVAALARAAEERLPGGPQDVEWALDPEGRLWLLQARPITALAAPESAAPGGSWTRQVALDLWADRLTPYLASLMLANAPRFDLSGACRALGVPVVQPALATIDGFLYVNCASLSQVLTILPRRLRLPDLAAFFPPGFELESVRPPGTVRLLALAARAALLALRSPGANPLLALPLARRSLRRLDRRLGEVERLPAASPEAALAAVERAADLLARAQAANQWPYLHATVATMALRSLAVGAWGLSHADFLTLLTGGATNVTQEIEGRIRHLARLLADDPDLARRLAGTPPERRMEALPEPLRRELAAFLAPFGCRARHRTLTVPRWAEAPEEVVGMLLAVGGEAPAARDPAAPRRTASGVLRRLPLLPRLAARPLAGLARRLLDLREDLRFFLDRVLLVLRRSLLALGSATGLGDGVLYLTAAELRQLVPGRGARAELDLGAARERITRRRRKLARPAEAASFYVHGRPVEPTGPASEALHGVGTSPGRASGRARIVSDPTRVAIAPGDVLVAVNTDPGWTPVLAAVAALVVEEGGLLNHCSIVARELGIPAVVGVRQATRRIPEGARVTVDGGLGTVRLPAGGS